MTRLCKIVSGGQIGVDRAALEAAIHCRVPHGGWCPAGRKSEGGRIPMRYGLTETPSAAYAQRTEWNVRDSDGTVIFSMGERLRGGSRRTAEMALQYGRPCLHLAAARRGMDPVTALLEFIGRCRIRVLNVAGPRKSQEPGSGHFARRVLMTVLRQKPRSNGKHGLRKTGKPKRR